MEIGSQKLSFKQNKGSWKMSVPQNKEAPKVSGFIKKLYEIVETPAFQKIICWSEDGKSVKIWSFKELEAKVLSFAFRHRNYHSFIRQLNMYGFKKQQRTSSNKSCSFVHPLFHRGCQDQLPLIKPASLRRQDVSPQKDPQAPEEIQKKSVEIDEGKRRVAEVYASFSKFRVVKKFKVNKKPQSKPVSEQPPENGNLAKGFFNQSYKEMRENYNRKNVTEKKSENDKYDSLLKMESLSAQNDCQSSQKASLRNSIENSQKQNQVQFSRDNLALPRSKRANGEPLTKYQGSADKPDLIEKQIRSEPSIEFYKNSVLSNTCSQQLLSSMDLMNYKGNGFPMQSCFYPQNYMSPMMSAFGPYVQMVPQQMFPSIPQMCYQPVYYNSIV